MGCCVLGLVPHQEHRVNHVARATDRTKVSADVIQLAAHEVDTAPEQAASDSEGNESASDSHQNDPPSSLVADAEQYELMQIACEEVKEVQVTPDTVTILAFITEEPTV